MNPMFMFALKMLVMYAASTLKNPKSRETARTLCAEVVSVLLMAFHDDEEFIHMMAAKNEEFATNSPA